ncbi:hypothetical protein AAG906_014260 [Vitis piasezkii]
MHKKMNLSSLFRSLLVVCFIVAFFALQLDLVTAGPVRKLKEREVPTPPPPIANQGSP